MLLDELVTAIETVQNRIKNHSTTLSQIEYRTRISLIDPILIALGWDVSDSTLVTVEYEAGKGRADYALLGPNGLPKAVLEAKRLGEIVSGTKSAHSGQLLRYADELGTNLAGLSDGDQWIFRNFSGGLGDESYFLDLRLSQASPHESALKLLALWQPNLATGQPIEANEPVIAIDKTVAPPDPAPNPYTKPIEHKPVPHESIPLSEYDAANDKKPPQFIILPDNSQVQITSWYEVLEQTCEWLIRAGHMPTNVSQVPSGPSRFMINHQAIHKDGKDFKNSKVLSNGLFLEASSDKKSLISYSLRLLELCNQSSAPIYLRHE